METELNIVGQSSSSLPKFGQAILDFITSQQDNTINPPNSIQVPIRKTINFEHCSSLKTVAKSFGIKEEKPRRKERWNNLIVDRLEGGISFVWDPLPIPTKNIDGEIGKRSFLSIVCLRLPESWNFNCYCLNL